MSRPLSVWLVLGVIVLAGVLLLIALLVGTVLGYVRLMGASLSGWHSLVFLLGFLVRLTVLGFLVTTFIGIWKARPKARSAGLAALLLIFSFTLISELAPVRPSQGLPKFVMRSAAEEGGALIGKLALSIAFWILFSRFGFSRQARLYFSSTQAACEGG